MRTSEAYGTIEVILPSLRGNMPLKVAHRHLVQSLECYDFACPRGLRAPANCGPISGNPNPIAA
jgi:hypothetical protein